MRADAALRALVDELFESAAAIAHASPARTLPPGFQERVFAAIQTGEKVVPFPAPTRWLPWAIAAALAITCTVMFFQLAETRNSLAEAAVAPALQVSVLGSKIASAPQASAVVIWDEKKQAGWVRLEGAPVPEPGRTYQLWIIDPTYKAPVSGGVISAEAAHSATAFQTTAPIQDAQKFAISIEKSGGVAHAEGPIVFLGN